MQSTKISSEILAHWYYEDDLWRDFLEYDSTIYKGSVRAAKHFFFGFLILTVVVVFLIVSITLLVTKEWNFDLLGPAIAFGFLGWIFIITGGIFWLYRRDRMNRLQSRTGEVIISLEGIDANGVEFNWGFGAFDARFDKVERKTVSAVSGKSFEILEFFTVHHTTNSDGRWRENFEMRLPIPFGKEAEAERVVSRLRAQLLEMNQEWINANFALGHSFSQGICRMCGETVAEAAAFRNYKCRG
jgi:hypothetical protein